MMPINYSEVIYLDFDVTGFITRKRSEDLQLRQSGELMPTR